MNYLPQYHDIKLYLQIKDFREEYEKFADEDKCEGFDELFMSIYDKVVMTWNDPYFKPKNGKRIRVNYSEPVVVTIENYCHEKIAKKWHLNNGDEYTSQADMARKVGISATMICYWKAMGLIKNVI